jgi:signal transduction histidine kinase
LASLDDSFQSTQVDDAPELRAHRLWQAMMARLPGTAVFVFDRELVLEVAEGSALIDNGHDGELLVGRSLTEVIPPAARIKLLPHCLAALDGTSGVAHVRTTDGRLRFDVDVVPLPGRGGQIEGGMMVARDVTERHNREVLGRALRLQDDERTRIATELHDDAVQVMTASLFALDRLEWTPGVDAGAVAETRRVLAEAVERIRRLALSLRPPLLVIDGLPGALPSLARRFTRTSQLRVEADVRVGRQDETVETLVYRTVHDLLDWLEARSGASHARLTLRELDGVLDGELRHDAPAADVCVPAVERVRLAGGLLTHHAGSVSFRLPLEPLPG